MNRKSRIVDRTEHVCTETNRAEASNRVNRVNRGRVGRVNRVNRVNG